MQRKTGWWHVKPQNYNKNNTVMSLSPDKGSTQTASLTIGQSLEDVFEHVLERVARLDKNACHLSVNQAYADMFGYHKEEMVGLPIAEIVHPEDIDLLDDKLCELQANGRTELELRARRQDSSILYIQLVLVKGLNSENNSVYHYCFVRDITDSVLQERQSTSSIMSVVKKQEQQFHSLVQNIPGVVFRCNASDYWSFDYISAGISKITGFMVEDILHGVVSYADLVHPDDLSRVKKVIDTAVSNKTTYVVDYRLNVADNREIWLRERATCTCDDQGKVISIDGIFRDISDEKSRDKQLLIARTLIDDSVNTAFWINEPGQIIYANAAAEELLQYTNEELLTLSLFDIDVNASPEKRKSFLESMENNDIKTKTFETRVKRKDGQEVPVEVTSSYIEVGNEVITCATVRDISQRLQVRLFEKITQSSSDMIAFIDKDYVYRDANNTYAEAFNLTRDQLVGRGYSDVSGSDRFNTDAGKNIEGCFEGKHIAFRGWFEFPGGSYGYYHVKYDPVIEKGEVIGVVILVRDLTHLFKTQEALQLSEEKFSKAFETSPDLMMISSMKEGKPLSVNGAFTRLTGYSLRDIQNKRSVECYADPDDYKFFIQSLKESGSCKNFESHIYRKSGDRLPVVLSAHVIELRGEKCIFTVARDISERKKVERALKESNEKFQGLIDDLNVIVWEMCLPELRFTFVSEPAERILGYSLQEWYTDGFWVEHVHPEDRDHMLSFCSEATRRGEDHEFEYRMVGKDGEVVWIRDIVHVVKDKDGNASVLRGVMLDVTQSKLAEKALRESRLVYQTAVDASPDQITITRLKDGRIVDANQAAIIISGYSREELLVRRTDDLLCSNNRSWVKFLQQIKDKGQYVNSSVMVKRKDGSSFPCMLSSTLIEYDGEACSFNIMRDITELTAAYDNLKEREQQFSLIFNAMPLAVSYVDKQFRYRFNNAEFDRLYGLQDGASIGKTIEEVVGTNSFSEIRPYLQRVMQGEFVKHETTIKNTKGEFRTFDVNMVPEFRGSDFQGVFIVRTDITEQKNSEIAIRRKNRALRVLSECNDALVKTKNEMELLQSICNIIIETGGYQFTWVGYAQHDERKTVKPMSFAGREEGFLSNRISWEDEPVGRGPAGSAIRTGKPYVIRNTFDVEETVEWREQALDLGYYSAIGLPLKLKDEMFGSLVITSPETHAFDQEERNLLERLAENLAFGIQSVRETEKRQRAEDLLALENYAFQLIASGPSFEVLIKDIVQHIEMTLNETYCSVLLLSDDGRHLYNCASPSLPRDYVRAVDGLEIGPNVGSCGSAAYKNKRVVVSDISADPLWNDFRELALEHGLRACHSTPICGSDGHVIGTFANYYEATREPDAEELRVIDRMTHIISGAIERYQATEAIRESEERFTLAMKGAQDGLWDWDLLTGEAYFSPRWNSMIGYEETELPFHFDSFVKLLHEGDSDKLFRTLDDYVKNRSRNFEIEFRLQHKNGHYIEILSRGFGLRDEDNRIVRMVGTHVDITDRKRTELLIQESEKRFRSLYHDTPSMFFTLDDNGKILSVNRFGAVHLGFSVDELINCSIFDITESSCEQTLKDSLSACLVVPDRLHHCEFRQLHKYNDVIWVRATLRLIQENGSNVVLVSCEDISETKILSEQLEYQAKHDSLTGLINRAEFERRLRRVLSEELPKEEHALCYLDLDQFKVINDTCGHLAGDELLRRISDLLNTVIRKRDTLARLGGDEFAVLLEHCPLDQARRVANDLLETIQSFRFAWEGKRFDVGVSIGLVPIYGNEGTLSNLLSAADEACYAAKDAGRNRVHVYHPDDVELTRRRGEMQWVGEINGALEEDRFRLAVQPIKYLGNEADGYVGNHCELLLRMEDQDGKIIMPGSFLPAAERYNLSVKLDKWVVKSAFRWLLENPKEMLDLKLCSINLSGHSIDDPEFLDFLLQQFQHGKVPPEKICFEITETAAIANLRDAITFIHALKEIGCYFALDDFGTGLSSFNYLKNLPVDFLKIDGSFVRDILRDPIDFAMVRSINEIGQVMGKKTIAEFVENTDILEALSGIGINYAQGYAIGRPELISDN